MPIPETTSAEAFSPYVGGKCLRAGRGKAWRDIKAWIVAPPRVVDLMHLPSVSEPFLAWTMSGVTAGCGRAQRWGGTVEEIRPGDVVWFPPGEKHWHGAAPTTAMTHIAIQEQLDGKVVEWMEKVSDEQYNA